MQREGDTVGTRDRVTGCGQAARDLVTGSSCLGCATPGRWWCPACRVTGDPRPARPDPRPVGLGPCVAAAAYEGVVASAVVAHKDRGAVELARPLGRLLAVSVSALLEALGPGPEAGGAPCLLLVPVPSRPAVVRARGGDPLLRLAQVAARHLRADRYGGPGPPTGAVGQVRVARLLSHRGLTADQADLDAAGRSANLVGAFACPAPRLRRWAGDPAVVVVVDDVITTGATAREARVTLGASGVPVLGSAVVAATHKRIPTAASGPATPRA